MQRFAQLIIVTVFLWTSTGCAILQGRSQSITPSSDSISLVDDDSDFSDEEDWGSVGELRRTGLAREKDPDGWLRKFTVSERAQAIEKRLGID